MCAADRGLAAAGPFDQDREFISAQPRDHRARGHAFLEPPGGLFQRGVAARMAERIVHILEVIEIDPEDRHRVVGLAPLERAGERGGEQRAIGQVGQHVVMGHVIDLVLRLARAGDIGHEAAPVAAGAVAGGDLAGRDRPPALLAADPQRHDEAAEILVLPAHLAQFVPFGRIVEQVEQLHALQLRRRAPGGVAEAAAGAQDVTVFGAFEQPVAAVFVVLVEQQLDRVVRLRQLARAQPPGREHVVQVEDQPVEPEEAGHGHHRASDSSAGSNERERDCDRCTVDRSVQHGALGDRDQCGRLDPHDHHRHGHHRQQHLWRGEIQRNRIEHAPLQAAQQHQPLDHGKGFAVRMLLGLHPQVDRDLGPCDRQPGQHHGGEDGQRHERQEDDCRDAGAQDIVDEVGRRADVFDPRPRPPFAILFFRPMIDQPQVQQPVENAALADPARFSQLAHME